jgi:hypothetical protein
MNVELKYSIDGHPSTIKDISYQEYITRFWIYNLGSKIAMGGVSSRGEMNGTFWDFCNLPKLVVRVYSEYKFEPISEEEFYNYHFP